MVSSHLLDANHPGSHLIDANRRLFPSWRYMAKKKKKHRFAVIRCEPQWFASNKCEPPEKAAQLWQTVIRTPLLLLLRGGSHPMNANHTHLPPRPAWLNHLPLLPTLTHFLLSSLLNFYPKFHQNLHFFEI